MCLTVVTSMSNYVNYNKGRVRIRYVHDPSYLIGRVESYIFFRPEHVATNVMFPQKKVVGRRGDGGGGGLHVRAGTSKKLMASFQVSRIVNREPRPIMDGSGVSFRP